MGDEDRTPDGHDREERDRSAGRFSGRPPSALEPAAGQVDPRNPHHDIAHLALTGVEPGSPENLAAAAQST